MKVSLLEDRVLIRRAKAEDVSKGGIVLPEVAKDKAPRGEVVAIGPGKRCERTGELLPMSIKVGQVVIFTQWAGSEIKDMGDGVLVMRESDIIGVVG